jgi:hypothetical protein
VRDTDVAFDVPMFAGALAEAKFTLCGIAPNVHVTVPPTATFTVGTVNAASVVPTAAVSAPDAGGVTVTAAVAVAVVPSRVNDAVITVVPGAMPVTTPAELTIAVLAAAVVNVAPEAPAIALPLASRALACSDTVPPIPTLGLAGVTANVANFWATVKDTVAVAAPLVAVMVTDPSETAVTVAVVPLPLTVATPALLDE